MEERYNLPRKIFKIRVGDGMAWLKGTGKVWYSVARGDTEGVEQRGWRRRGRCGTAWLEATRKVTKGDVSVMNIHGDSDAGGSGRTYRGGRRWGQAMGAGDGGRQWGQATAAGPTLRATTSLEQQTKLLEGILVLKKLTERGRLTSEVFFPANSEGGKDWLDTNDESSYCNLPVVNARPTAASPSRSPFSTEVLPPSSEGARCLRTVNVNAWPLALPPLRSPFSTEVLPPSRVSSEGVVPSGREASNLRTVNVNAWPLALPPLRSPFSTEVLPPSRVSSEGVVPSGREGARCLPDVNPRPTAAPSIKSLLPPMAGRTDTIHLSWCRDASVLSLHAALQGRRLPPVLSEGCSWTCLDGDPFIHSVPGQYIVVWASNYGSGGQSMPTSSMPTSAGWLIIQTCWYWGVFATMVSVWVVESLTMSLCYVLTVSILVQPFGSWYLWVIWL
ncbi:hypothetical protein EDD15DRAFT_2199004 [Pisolithus albus]|nr:hypothetical protein EDD15DRAFT_2199004 [Pisolithus albus]